MLYVDAAEYPCGKKFAISVVDSTGSVATAASIQASSSEEAEEAAVALATTIPNSFFIISDSKTAIHNFGAGRVCRAALAILSRNPPSHLFTLLWTPAHAGLIGNEAAHASARAFTIRAQAGLGDGSGASNLPPPFTSKERLLTYHDICGHYRLGRQTLPPLMRRSSRMRKVLWRRLQTRSFLSPALRHKI